jgi:hypothetical protein
MMFPKAKRCKADTFKGMIQILDKVFSEYIRRRGTLSGGYAKCITCGVIKHWKEMDCGHYIQRDRYSTRFDEKNCHAQCPHCNRFRTGEQSLHGKAIDRMYGKGTSDQLLAISRIPAKFDEMWLKFHIKLYRDKIKRIKYID